MCVRGRLTLVNDDLHTEWESSISMFMDMIRVEVKDASDATAAYDAERQARRQERPMDVLKEVKERSAIIEKAHSWIVRYMADPTQTEEMAITFRQIIYVILCLKSGHRTGIWKGLTLKEFRTRHQRSEVGSDITHLGGKNKKHMGATTVVIDDRTDDAVMFYVSSVRGLLRKGSSSDLLLPGLDVTSQRNAAKALGLSPERLSTVCNGNNCRRFHASAGFALQESGNLTDAETRLLAFYRRHSAGIAERTYEQRSRRELDSRAQRGFLEKMTALEAEAVAGPSGHADSRTAKR